MGVPHCLGRRPLQSACVSPHLHPFSMPLLWCSGPAHVSLTRPPSPLAVYCRADPARRLTVAEVQAHPWFRVGLSPAALSFNDRLVADSLAHAPAAGVLEEVRAIVAEAGHRPGALAAGAGDGVTDDVIDNLLQAGDSCDMLPSAEALL